jgi:Flp pilus assembly protein TadG
MTLLRRNDGQATVLAAAFMVGAIGLTAFVLDVGSWFHAQRASQSTVDAAALAGAQVLPTDPSQATSLATNFANKNGGVAGASISISSTYNSNDTITVAQTRSAPGFFANLFGISTVNVSAHATAISEVPDEALLAAPIAVNIKHPMLSGPGCPCYGQLTTLPLGKAGAPGAFALLNLDLNNQNGTVGASTLGDWIANGYDGALPLGSYFSDPGAKWNDNPIQAAIQGKYGKELLFPVYDTLSNQGSNADYHVVAWAAFHITGSTASGTSGSITGYFTKVNWNGVILHKKGNGQPVPDLGVHTVALID